MPKNTLISPFLGKIKLPDNSHIRESFKPENSQKINCVTSLLISTGSYVDATTSDQPDNFSLKRKLASDKHAMICTEKISSEITISIFNELLQNKTSIIDTLPWERNTLNFGNKKVLFIYLFLFLAFNIALITLAKNKLSENQNTATEQNKKAKNSSVEPSYEEKVIRKINNEYYLINPANGNKGKIDNMTNMEDLFNKKSELD